MVDTRHATGTLNSKGKHSAATHAQQNVRTPWTLYLIPALVVLQLSQVSTPLGMLIGFGSSQIPSIILTFLAIFALLVEIRRLKFAATDLEFVKWNAIIFVIPSILILIQAANGIMTLEKAIYWSFFSLNISTIYSTSYLYGKFSAQKQVLRTLTFSFLLVLVGFAINYINYEYTRDMFKYMSSGLYFSKYLERKASFFPHPNTAAAAVLFCTIGIAALIDRTKGRASLRFGLYAAALLGILATGSRTALLALTAFALLDIVKFIGSASQEDANNRVLALLGIPLALAVILVPLQGLFPGVTSGLSTGIERATGVFSAIGGTSDDASLSLRSAMLSAYIERSADHPFIGHGIQAGVDFVRAGILAEVSQNSWIQWAFYFGYAYPVLVFVALINSILLARRRSSGAHAFDIKSASASYAIILITILFYTLSVVDVFYLKPIIIIMALAAGQISTLRKI